MEQKRLPIGISDYKQLIEDDYYFVDKTNLIRQIIEEGSKIIMLPRPRRFGKTLNLSILRYFFERTEGSPSFRREKHSAMERFRQIPGAVSGNHDYAQGLQSRYLRRRA